VAAVTWALSVAPVAADTAPTADVIAASDHTCVVTIGGGVKCWGDNSAGGLGDGTKNASSTPVDVVGLASGVIAIAAGDRYACALTSDGGVRCWGYNELGQLGDGTTSDRTSPVDVMGLASGVQAIDARGEHTCAVSSGGGLKCWGWNATGQVGIRTIADLHAPVDVPGLVGAVSAVSAGGRHTCALMAAGGIKCWGYNEFGQLGDGTTTDSPMPVAVAGLPSRVRAITTGGNFSCALRSDGGVSCWGLNSAGQLGGTSDMSAVPVGVAGLTSGISAIAAGFYHACGVTTDGGVTCWGGNETGQLGIGTTSGSPTMTGVKNADGTLLMAAGGGISERSNVPLLAVAVLVGLLILAAGGFWLARRRGQ